jgi:maltooligosyltrehalose trehalohydrolase
MLRSPRVHGATSPSALRSAPPLGVRIEGGVARARVVAPDARRVEVVVEGLPAPIALEPEDGGTFAGALPGVRAGARYRFRLDGGEPLKDPASRSQPDGVDGPSEVVDLAFPWTDDGWPGLAADRLVVYEAHVGAATTEGTFDALARRLPELRALGFTAIELLPVASFPGRRNWGYDGVDLFAPAASYGGPAGLARFVDAAHAAGLGVILDVVYNHLGPHGNVLPRYVRSCFSERHGTPWGPALDFDGPGAAAMRALVLENVAMWTRDYHVDGLRLDATDAIVDTSTPHLLAEIGEVAREAASPRRAVVIAEDARNDARIVAPIDRGGLGLDGVWADDLHHAVRRALTDERTGFAVDYDGSAAELARVLERGWLYEGRRSRRTGRPRGTPARDVPPERIVVSLQNHDQVGNRPGSRRLSADVSPAALRAATALLLLSPFTPLVFMGQEYGASMPFPFFTEHPRPLGRRVARARRREIASFLGGSPRAVPSSQAPATFAMAKLDDRERAEPPHAALLALHRELLALRAGHPALAHRARGSFSARAVGRNAIVLERRGERGERALVVVGLRGRVRVPVGARANVVLSTEAPRFGGRGGGVALASGSLFLLGPCACLVEVEP